VSGDKDLHRLGALRERAVAIPHRA
jgi:hypothetical protein